MRKVAKKNIRLRLRKPKPSKFSNALLIQNSADEILWLQRPDNGIWGGLWSLPLEFIEKVADKKADGKVTDKTRRLPIISN